MKYGFVLYGRMVLILFVHVLNLISKTDTLEQAKEQTEVKANRRKKEITRAVNMQHLCSMCAFFRSDVPSVAFLSYSSSLPDFIPTSRFTVFWISRIYKDVCLNPAARQDLSRKHYNRPWKLLNIRKNKKDGLFH